MVKNGRIDDDLWGFLEDCWMVYWWFMDDYWWSWRNYEKHVIYLKHLWWFKHSYSKTVVIGISWWNLGWFYHQKKPVGFHLWIIVEFWICQWGIPQHGQVGELWYPNFGVPNSQSLSMYQWIKGVLYHSYAGKENNKILLSITGNVVWKHQSRPKKRQFAHNRKSGIDRTFKWFMAHKYGTNIVIKIRSQKPSASVSGTMGFTGAWTGIYT